MRFASLAGLMTSFALAGVGASSAAAQTLPLEMFAPTKQPIAPATVESAAQGFNLSAAPLPTATFHPRAAPAAKQAEAPPPEKARPASGEQVVAATQPLAASAPIPPSRPSAPPSARVEPQGSEPIEITPKPVVTAAAGPVTALRSEPLSNKAVVDRANAYFTNLGTLVADFTQVGGDGRRIGGTLYLQRPGKVRFEYDPPATLEVIADGSSVAVRDRKLATQDLYSISQTPLKFLLREQVNLGQDIAITGITSETDGVRINLEDHSTLGGTSRITLFFDPNVETLNQWRIVDPQGFQTVVVLNKAERGRRIDQSLFKIQYEAILGGNNR